MVTVVGDDYTGTGSMVVPAATQAGDIILILMTRNATTAPTQTGTLSGLTSLDTGLSNAAGNAYWKEAEAGDDGDTVTWAGSTRRGIMHVFRPAAGETVDDVVLIDGGIQQPQDAEGINYPSGETCTEGDVFSCMQRAKQSNAEYTTIDSDLTITVDPPEYNANVGNGERGILGGYDIMGSGETSSPQYNSLRSGTDDDWTGCVFHVQTTIAADVALVGQAPNAANASGAMGRVRGLVGSAPNAADGRGILTGGATDLVGSAPNAGDARGVLTGTIAIIGSAPNAGDGRGVLTGTIGFVGSAPNANDARGILGELGGAFTGWGIPL